MKFNNLKCLIDNGRNEIMKLKFMFFLLVIILSGCDQKKIIQQNLNQIPIEYSYQQALKNGDVVIGTPGEFNLNKIDQFISDFSKKNRTSLRVTNYTQEGDPIISEISFTGDNISYSYDNTRDKHNSNKVNKKTTCINIKKIKNKEGTIYLLEGCKEKIGDYISDTSDEVILAKVK
jgi:hypothetical protein